MMQEPIPARHPGQFPCCPTSPWTQARRQATLFPGMPDLPPATPIRENVGRTALALVLTAMAGGAAGAAFLGLLDSVTRLHQRHAWLLYLLPLIGIGVGWVYHRFAGAAAKGTHLLIEQAQEEAPNVPFRLAPLILISTLMTHLGGGSAGREGTAVQMGGGIGGGISNLLGLGPQGRRLVLLGGMAAGFGAVFGTPFAAAVFAIECLQARRMEWRILPACLGTAWGAHLTCLACGGSHTHYDAGLPPLTGIQSLDLRFGWIAGAALAGISAGLMAQLYIHTGRLTARGFARIPTPWLRPVAGAGLLILLTFLLGNRSYLGLGAIPMDPGNPSIETAFGPDAMPSWSWALKLIFTVVTLGSGFKGGEVTPLFFMGATAGNALGTHVGLPSGLGAAAGLAAVFAGASRTPVACTLLGLELFGWAAAPYVAVACWASQLSSGHKSIYDAPKRTPREQ